MLTKIVLVLVSATLFAASAEAAALERPHRIAKPEDSLYSQLIQQKYGTLSQLNRAAIEIAGGKDMQSNAMCVPTSLANLGSKLRYYAGKTLRVDSQMPSVDQYDVSSLLALASSIDAGFYRNGVSYTAVAPLASSWSEHVFSKSLVTEKDLVRDTDIKFEDLLPSNKDNVGMIAAVAVFSTLARFNDAKLGSSFDWSKSSALHYMAIAGVRRQSRTILFVDSDRPSSAKLSLGSLQTVTALDHKMLKIEFAQSPLPQYPDAVFVIAHIVKIEIQR